MSTKRKNVAAEGLGVRVVRQAPKRATGERYRMGAIASGGHFYNPAHMLGKAIADASDPTKAHGKVRVLSKEEIAALYPAVKVK